VDNRWLLMSILAPFLSPAALPAQADGEYWYLIELGVFPIYADADPSESPDDSDAAAADRSIKLTR
jgi:hypothetical protein